MSVALTVPKSSQESFLPTSSYPPHCYKEHACKLLESQIIAMKIFMKKLTSVDIDRRLELPTDTKEEALPPFQGARDNVFPIMFEQPGSEFDVHCSCGPGRLEFTKGWIRIVRHLRLNAGDVLTLHREDQGGYKMTVRRSASCA
ncbi:hypothetical protein POTOM_018183 [Populus tomentosa]|uniref:TF-B3 domain-containing protein n=1 Tax=Populus tomentosa TaxID=118781 RepID=A0A8X8D7C8_POPTO|nr:hypothetical protein POTOM_018183 [Populus tomentosa]